MAAVGLMRGSRWHTEVKFGELNHNQLRSGDLVGVRTGFIYNGSCRFNAWLTITHNIVKCGEFNHEQ